jgi:hypothetical protein
MDFPDRRQQRQAAQRRFPAMSLARSAAGRLEQLDQIAGGILEQDLRPPGPVTISLRKLTPAARSRAGSRICRRRSPDLPVAPMRFRVVNGGSPGSPAE